MKIIFVPLYMPVPYAGATPAPYLSSKVDAYERKLVALSPVVARSEAMVLLPALDGRFVDQRPVRAYSVFGDVDAIVSMTLKHYDLPRVHYSEDGFLYVGKLDDLGEVESREVKL